SSYLVIGGRFNSIDGVPFHSIARLNDTVATGWRSMGAGCDDDVTAITRFNGSTYAAGRFTASGSTALNHIARWDGATWQPVGQGPITGVNAGVTCMKSFPDGPSARRLVVCGGFSTAGGVPVNRAAMLTVDPATQLATWSPMGDGFNGAVYALEYVNGFMYAAGDFTASGSTPLSYIARWNGSAWEPVGGGTNGQIRAMTVSNGTLVVGGTFTIAGGQAAERLARWNGSNWSPIGGGVDHVVYALGTFLNELQVGGEFTRVRSNVLESPLWARFSEDGVPWFAGQPISQEVSCRGDAVFQIAPALGYGGLRYQWRRNGIALTNGPTGRGSTILSNGLTLHVLNANEGDAGLYDCVLSNACGGTTSASAMLSVLGECPACPADFNADGEVNSQDFFDFLVAFFATESLADFNHNGVVDSQDFFDFLAAFFVGCQ
ncbi:MAG: hypothetical protein H7210_01665, partial [Pyrinomonadaceae bacterium]|nr:hypothetical protein [Phycisphaerales bacterium]